NAGRKNLIGMMLLSDRNDVISQFALLAPVGGVNVTGINNAFLKTLTLCVCQHKQESFISTVEKTNPREAGLLVRYLTPKVYSVSDPEGSEG
ncbi:hypothetical protein, partial [Alishewanella tabrizica]|uniref:hypothetical protein n=1 Tax=Alishewanella tabrizica TaxID=671278 RepID=UPI00167555A1